MEFMAADPVPGRKVPRVRRLSCIRRLSCQFQVSEAYQAVRFSAGPRQDAAHARMAVVEAEDDVRAAEESLARARDRATERKANQLLEERRAILRRRLDERDRASAALEALEAQQIDCGNEKGRPGDDMVATMHWASTPAASRAARSVREKARRRASP